MKCEQGHYLTNYESYDPLSDVFMNKIKSVLTSNDLVVSVVIPTINRENELEEVLNSLLEQKLNPNEILVIDDSINENTKNLVEKLMPLFLKKNVMLRLIRNYRKKSLTAARNVGVKHSIGDIVLFLDDDVVLDTDYLYAIMNIYRLFPNAKAVQGYWGDQIKDGAVFRMKNILCNFLFLMSYKKDQCNVMSSFNAIYPSPLTKVINCQWLSGCNQSYKRVLFEKFDYDEHLFGYSLGEDLDFSYRIYKNLFNASKFYNVPIIMCIIFLFFNNYK